MLAKNKIRKFLTNPLGLAQFLIGVLVAGLGLAVMLAWHLGKMDLLRSIPTSIVMAYNTALCFFVCGIIIVANLFKLRNFGIFLQVCVVLFGCAILVEDFAGLDLGIDQLLMSYQGGDFVAFPGRVPLNSAVSFILIGIAYFLLAVQVRRREIVASSFGAAVFGFGTVALTGYYFDIPMAYGWGSFSQMATMTAFGTVLLGVGTIITTWHQESPNRLKLPKWTPLIVFLGVAVITIDLFYALTSQQNKTITQTLNSRIFEVQSHIKGALGYRISLLTEFETRWKKEGYIDPADWQKDAVGSMRMFSDFRSVAYVDRDLTPKWVVPSAERSLFSVAGAHSRFVLENHINRARREQDFTVSEPFEFEAGRQAFLICLPVRAKETTDGYLVAIVDLGKFLQNALLSEIKNDYSLSMAHQGRAIYELGATQVREIYVEKEIDLFGVQWVIRMYPNHPLDDGLSTTIHRVQFGVGLIVSTLLGLIFYFLQNSRRAIRKNKLANRRLSREIETRKRLEAKLILAKDVADKSSKLKAAFLANMSHEIRTPMSSVIGASELLLETELSPDQVQYVHLIQNNGEMLLTIINDILDLSKIEEDKLVFENVEFNLPDTISVVNDLFAFAARQKGLSIVVRYGESVPEKLRGDPRRLQQVLINLMSNAVKFTDRGKITLKIDCLDISDDQARIGFSLTDTGIGIPKEARKNIFMPFTQADGSTTRKYGGTGLGLSICEKLVKLMGGSIGLQSEVDHGSTFWFTARFETAGDETGNPSVQSPPASHLQSLQTLRQARRKNEKTPFILIVEDNLTNQIILKRRLEQLGVQVDVAGNGQKALERVAAQKYDLILMDCQMPLMDGYEATRRIRRIEKPPARRIPVIALTANAMSGDAQKCLAAGMDGYLSKPIRRADLEKVLDEWLDTDLVGREERSPRTKARPDHHPGDHNGQIFSIDERMSMLADECGPEAVEQLVAVFFEDTSTKLVHLRQLLYRPERSYQIVRMAHTLKGACLNFGATEMADLCAKLEKSAAANDAETSFFLLEQLKCEYDRILTAVEGKYPAKFSGAVALAGDNT